MKELKEYGKEMVITLCNAWIKAEEQREKPQNLEDAVNGTQYMILKLAQNGLFAKGILKFKKEEIVKTFLREYPEFPENDLVDEAYKIREKWNTLKDNESLLKKFIEKTKTFPQDFKEFMIRYDRLNTGEKPKTLCRK